MSTAIKEVYRHQGIKGFYTGYLSLIMREIPFSSIQMPFYEMLKLTAIKFTAKKNGIAESEVKLGGLQLAMMGSIAGSFYGGFVTPFDVLKTRLMTHDVKQKKMTTTQTAQLII